MCAPRLASVVKPNFLLVALVVVGYAHRVPLAFMNQQGYPKAVVCHALRDFPLWWITQLNCNCTETHFNLAVKMVVASNKWFS